ncbi:MAG: DNA mismatch repair protein MutS [Peptococcaceae bacterium]|nr:DNA mismatch repair protein MutS [Peptococcaceae bacterium]
MTLARRVDIHQMTKADAKLYLERLIAGLPADVSELVVIHGYRSGSVLQNLVRRELKSKRICRRILSLNPGETTLLLQPPAGKAKGSSLKI